MRHLPSAISLRYSKDYLDTLSTELEFSEDEITKSKNLLSNNLPPLVRADVLPFLLGISLGFLLAMHMNPDKYYRVYEIYKAGGGTRQIEAPRRYLKLIQRWINHNILNTNSIPSYVNGFVKGRNIFTNAEIHLNNQNIMILDIEDFFPSVKFKHVRNIFINYGFPSSVVRLLSKLCTYQDRLPQGAPTSPTLANLMFLPIDYALNDLAKTWKCSYSRYADDIAFSGDINFTIAHKEEARQIISKYKFSINEQKSRIIGSGGRQILAGLVVNKSGLPPRENRRKWRAIFHQAALQPEKFKESLTYLEGIASFINEYDKNLADKYRIISSIVANE